MDGRRRRSKFKFINNLSTKPRYLRHSHLMREAFITHKKKLEPLLGKENIEFHSIKRDSSNLINISLSPIVLSTEKFDGFFLLNHHVSRCTTEKNVIPRNIRSDHRASPVSPHDNFQIHFPITRKSLRSRHSMLMPEWIYSCLAPTQELPRCFTKSFTSSLICRCL